MITYPEAELDHTTDGAQGARAPRASAPGRSTLTSRLGASPASIARAVIAQLKEDASAVQARGGLDGPDVHAVAAQGTSGAGGQLPHLDQIQRAFGNHDVSGVRAHVGGAAADASASLGALAYAAGDDVAFASAPDLHLAAHEAAHVVQQRAGVRLAGGVGAAGDEYERHADQVADAVCRGEFVEDLLGGKAHRGAAGGPAVQRRTEHINVPWGTDALGDGSSIDLDPSAEVWVNGSLVAQQAISRMGSVAIPRGVSGVVRLRCRIRYDIEHTLPGSDETGTTEVAVGMRFTTDASGRLTWNGPSPRHIGSPDTRSFTLGGSATGEGTTLSATVQFTGVSGQGPAVSANGSIPEVAGGQVESGRTQYPQGGFPVDYVINLTGVTAAPTSNEGGDGPGGNSSNAQADARATNRAEGGNGTGGNGTGGNGTGGASSSSAQSNPQVNTNVAPVNNNNVVVQCPPGQEGQQQGPQPQQPEPGQQEPPRAAIALPQPYVAIYQDEADVELPTDVINGLGTWMGALSPELRAELAAGRCRLEIETQASTTGTRQSNQRLTDQRAAILLAYVSPRSPSAVANERIRSMGELSPDGSPREDNQPLANFRRATISVAWVSSAN